MVSFLSLHLPPPPLSDWLSLEHFERAAALALWHGNISLAVKVLQRTIKANKAMAAAAASSTGHKDDEQQLEEDEDAIGERFIDELTPGSIPLSLSPFPQPSFQSTSSCCLSWRCASLGMPIDPPVSSSSNCKEQMEGIAVA